MRFLVGERTAGKAALQSRGTDRRTEKQRAHARQWVQGPHSDAWLRGRQLSGWEKLLRALGVSEAAAVEELRRETAIGWRLRKYVERLCHKRYVPEEALRALGMETEAERRMDTRSHGPMTEEQIAQLVEARRRRKLKAAHKVEAAG